MLTLVSASSKTDPLGMVRAEVSVDVSVDISVDFLMVSMDLECLSHLCTVSGPSGYRVRAYCIVPSLGDAGSSDLRFD